VVTDEKLDLVRVDFQLLLAEVTEDSTVPFEERARADGTQATFVPFENNFKLQSVMRTPGGMGRREGYLGRECVAIVRRRLGGDGGTPRRSGI
jgi:hypothetical protein